MLWAKDIVNVLERHHDMVILELAFEKEATAVIATTVIDAVDRSLRC